MDKKHHRYDHIRVTIFLVTIGAFVLMLSACDEVLTGTIQVTPEPLQPAIDTGRLLSRGNVSDAIYSPDGDQLAIASSTGVYLYDAHTFQQTGFIVTDAYIYNIAYSPSGELLAVPSSTGIYLYNAQTLQQENFIDTYDTPEAHYRHIALSSQLLAEYQGYNKRQVKLWDVISGQEVLSLNDHPDGIDCITFSPDGQTLAVGYGGGVVSLWDVTIGKLLHTFDGGSYSYYPVKGIAFSPDGKVLASAIDHQIDLWDLVSGQKLLDISTKSVTHLAFSPDGSMLVATTSEQGADGAIHLWDVANGQRIRSLKGFSVHVNSIAFSPGGEILAAGYPDRVKLWDVRSGQEIHTFSDFSATSYDIAFSPNGQTLASTSNDSVKLWDVISEQGLNILDGHTDRVSSVSFSPDGQILVSSSRNEIKLWDVTNGQVIVTYNKNNDDIALSPDGKSLASISEQGEIALWDIQTGQEVQTFTLPEVSSVIFDLFVTFSPDRKVLAAGSPSTVILWDIASGRELGALTEPDAGCYGDACVMVLGLCGTAFSPDARTLLVLNTVDDTIHHWDVFNNQVREIQNAPLSDGTISCHRRSNIIYSPDGTQYAIASPAGIYIYDTQTLHQIRHIETEDGIISIAFLPDGGMLAASGYRGEISVWDMHP